ncbi:hypothetical protein KC325_g251 [Hortaea werneckii]|nr:hypothetical protein KC325_g251 [Hortaea werneckii]
MGRFLAAEETEFDPVHGAAGRLAAHDVAAISLPVAHAALRTELVVVASLLALEGVLRVRRRPVGLASMLLLVAVDCFAACAASEMVTIGTVECLSLRLDVRAEEVIADFGRLVVGTLVLTVDAVGRSNLVLLFTLEPSRHKVARQKLEEVLRLEPIVTPGDRIAVFESQRVDELDPHMSVEAV